MMLQLEHEKVQLFIKAITVKKEVEMSKRKTEIKAIRAKRLKELIDAEGLTQTAFAKKVNYSQQLISDVINMKTALTEATAQDISSAFPEYSVQWLMGLSDHKNDADAFRDSINKMNEEGDLLNSAFVSLAALNGYRVNRLGYQGQSAEEVVTSLYEYVEIEHEGAVKTLTHEQLNQLENIICEHAEIAIRRFIEASEQRTAQRKSPEAESRQVIIQAEEQPEPEIKQVIINVEEQPERK